MYQVQYFCPDCKDNHFGNCPRIESTFSMVSSSPAEDQIISDNLFNLMESPKEDGFTKSTVWRKDIEEALKAQRQADIQRISYMFAIPVKDIEKVLESKV